MVPEPLFGYIRSLIFSDVVDNIFALLQAYLHQMVTFYTKWWFLEIEVFAILVIFRKCHKWIKSSIFYISELKR